MTYANRTDVSSDKTRNEIERVLIRYGAKEFAYAWREDEARIAFALANRRIIFRLPLPDREDREFRFTAARQERRSDLATTAAYDQAVRQRWRALLLIIKAKLEAVEAGIVTLDQEFGMWVLTADGRTVGDVVIPQIAASYAAGEIPSLVPLPRGSS